MAVELFWMCKYCPVAWRASNAVQSNLKSDVYIKIYVIQVAWCASNIKKSF